MNPYDELLRFADDEADLIRAGAWEELVAVHDERRELLARLPEAPPASARRQLELVLDRLDRNAAAIAAALAQTRGELDRAIRTRTRLGTYSQAAQPQLDFRG